MLTGKRYRLNAATRDQKMTPADPVPAWLANELMLDNAKFDEGGKTVTGQPSNHLRAVLDVGQGAPPIKTVRLTDAQLARLDKG
jgi:hypothetical protein